MATSSMSRGKVIVLNSLVRYVQYFYGFELSKATRSKRVRIHTGEVARRGGKNSIYCRYLSSSSSPTYTGAVSATGRPHDRDGLAASYNYSPKSVSSVGVGNLPQIFLTNHGIVVLDFD